MNEVEAVKAAIKLASCPGREGPFGGYDYGHNEAFYGPAPEDGRYVIRDFRDPKSPDWGKWLHQTDNREEHEAMFVKMTDDHIAQAAIAALDAARGDQVARVEALSDNAELLTIAWMDGSHRSTKAHRARIAKLEAEVERLRDGLAGAIAAISDPRGLDDAICCSGHMCGCRGSSHRELLLHDLSEVLARTALGASHDAA